MTVYLKLDIIAYEIGTDDFLNSFFSTVEFHLENNQRGNRFPMLFNKLYWGNIEYHNIPELLEELRIIKDELKKYSPDNVIWDIENQDKLPPWGHNISEEITDLSNYYITSDGRDFFDVMLKALGNAHIEKINLQIGSL